jgi:hypothetical protein
VDQVIRHRVRIDLDVEVGMTEERLDLRRQGEQVVGVIVEQRLLAGTIARESQPGGPVVPDRNREHAVQVGDAVGAFLLVQVDNRFRITSRSKTVTALHELLPQFAEVVDLAVEDDTDVAVLVRHRLIRVRRQIDDPQPTEAEGRASRR